MPPADLASRHAPAPLCVDIAAAHPNLVAGEDAAGYEALRERVFRLVQAKDVLEEIFVSDVVDLVWEAARLRRAKARLLEAARQAALSRVLEPLVGWPEHARLASHWALGEPDAMSKVEDWLAKAGLGMEHVMARALANQIDTIERLDRLIEGAEARRTGLLRKIERRRAALAQDLRRVADVEDAQFEMLPPDRA